MTNEVSTVESAFQFPRFETFMPESVADASTWQWISTLRPSEVRPVTHARHARWAEVKGNTHAPAHREILLTLWGRAIYFFEGKIYFRTPGTVILLDRYERRDLKGSPLKRNFCCFWLQLHSRDRLTYYLNHCDSQGRHRHDPPIGIKTGEQVQVAMDAWDYCSARPEDAMGWSLLKSSATALLLEALGRPAPSPATRTQQQIIHSVLEYIGAHLAEKLSLHSLARVAGYSPFFFHRLFLRYTGQTPVAYIHGVRFVRAKELLLQGYTVEATAEAVGFSSTSYFTEFFKRHAGSSPSQWRQMQTP